MENTVFYGVTTRLRDTVLPVAAFVQLVAINHILSAIYWNSNESSGGTCGCNGMILYKINEFHCSHNYTKEANIVAMGK
jgi:hypothetical protein